MSTQQASSTGVLRAAEVLDLTIAQANEAGRNDLVRRLSDARRLLVDSCITVHIVGDSQQGKSSLLEALSAPAGEGAVAGLAGRIITADAERTSLRAVANHTLSALDELTEMLRFRRSRLVLPGRADQARTEARLAEERIDSLHSRSARWRTLFYDSFATINSDVDFDLQQRMRAVLIDAEHTIEQGDPAKNFDELTTWLRQRLTHEARANHDLTVTSVRAVSRRAAEHFALSEMHLIDPPRAHIPTDLPTALTVDHVVSGTRAGLSAGMNIFLRSYIGFVMFFLLTGLTGVTLPLAIGLAPALLMGGLAVIEERKRQIDQRRGQASATVRNYITDFNVWVTKDSRDLLRQLEQQLRDTYAGRVEQLERALQAARSLALGTLKEQEQSPTLLAQLDTDLALLADLRGRATAIIPAELLELPQATLRRVA